MADNVRAGGAAGRNIATVAEYFRLLEKREIDTWIELWADDADHYYPFGTEMFPRHMAGKAAIYEFWKDVPSLFDSLSFLVQETWTDGDTVIARVDADNVMTGSGKRYQNSYLCLFKFDGAGKIREYWEYFDPIIAGVDFGLAEIKYQRAG